MQTSSGKIPDAKIAGDNVQEESTDTINGQEFMTGWRLYTISSLLLVSIFIVQMESSITSTAVLVITDDLGGYEISSWLFTAYFITYCGSNSYLWLEGT